MEKGTSFLFSGITFDKKKFAADFARFKVGFFFSMIRSLVARKTLEILRNFLMKSK